MACGNIGGDFVSMNAYSSEAEILRAHQLHADSAEGVVLYFDVSHKAMRYENSLCSTCAIGD